MLHSSMERWMLRQVNCTLNYQNKGHCSLVSFPTLPRNLEAKSSPYWLL